MGNALHEAYAIRGWLLGKDAPDEVMQGIDSVISTLRGPEYGYRSTEEIVRDIVEGVLAGTSSRDSEKP